MIFISQLLIGILFILTIMLVFYIPGRVVVEKLRYKDSFSKTFLSVMLGMSVYILSIYLLSYVSMQWLYYVVCGIALVEFLRKKYYKSISILPVKISISYVVLFIGTILMASLTSFSWVPNGNGISFQGINLEDGVIHVARIQNFLVNFPPVHPGLAEIPFRGYHYFYDLLLTSFVSLFRFRPEDLYFRYFSAFVACVYGFGFYHFTRRWFSKRVAPITLFFAYFSVGFASLMPAKDAIFSSNFAQPLMLIIDPSVLLSIALLLTVCAVLPDVKKNVSTAIIVAILVGILCQLKVYTGIVAITVLVSYSIYLFIRYRMQFFQRIFLMNALAAVITIVTYFPNNFGAGSLVFAPFLFYGQFIKQSYFANLHWETKRTIFAENNNYLRVVLLYIQASIIFWVITLGARLLLLYKLFALIKSSFWKKDENFIVFIAILFPLLMASFFIQSISVFDIGQFFWIAVALMSIPIGYVLHQIILRFRSVGIILLIGVCVLSVIEVKGYIQYFMSSSYHVSSEQLNFYSKVNSLVPDDTFIVLIPITNDEFGEYPPLINSALTGKAIYYENEKIEYPYSDLYDKRKNNIRDLHNSLLQCNSNKAESILNEINTRYILSYTAYPCAKNNEVATYTREGKNLFFYHIN